MDNYRGPTQGDEQQSASATYQRRYTHTRIPSDDEYHTYYRSSESRTTDTNTTLSSPSPITPSDLPPAYPLVTPTFPTTPMPAAIIPQDFPFFGGTAGDAHTAQPLQWLRRYENIFPAGTSDATMIQSFKHVLDPESPAEEWHDEWVAKNGQPATWADLKAGFKQRWKKTSMEVPKRMKRQLLLAITLAEEDVGMIVTKGQRKDQAHLLWADKVEEQWKILGDKEGLCIEDVERGLPRGFVDMMVISKDVESDWRKWLEAARAVDVRKAKDRIEELREREKMREWIDRMENIASTPAPTYTPYSTPRLTRSYQSMGSTILQQKMDCTTLNTPSTQMKTVAFTPQQPMTPTPHTY